MHDHINKSGVSNMHTNKHLKTIKKWIDSHPHIVDEWWIEEDGGGLDMGHGNFSYWLYFKPGYINWLNETHSIHPPLLGGASLRILG